MKLYELKRNTKFTLVDTPQVPPDCDPNDLGTGKVYTYTHVDGMYAPVKDLQGDTFYFAAWTEVITNDNSTDNLA
jgi:hypothetical protein